MHPDPEILLAEPTHLACQNYLLIQRKLIAQSHKYKQGNDLFASTQKKKRKKKGDSELECVLAFDCKESAQVNLSDPKHRSKSTTD